MYDRILVPLAEDAIPESVYEQIFALAEQHQSTLVFLSIANTNRDSVTTINTEVVDALELDATETVEQFAETAGDRGLTVETEVYQGVPHEEIVSYAESHDIDLIVMRKRDQGRLKKALLGSVTDRVIRLTDTPVLVI